MDAAVLVAVTGASTGDAMPARAARRVVRLASSRLSSGVALAVAGVRLLHLRRVGMVVRSRLSQRRMLLGCSGSGLIR